MHQAHQCLASGIAQRQRGRWGGHSSAGGRRAIADHPPRWQHRRGLSVLRRPARRCLVSKKNHHRPQLARSSGRLTLPSSGRTTAYQVWSFLTRGGRRCAPLTANVSRNTEIPMLRSFIRRWSLQAASRLRAPSARGMCGGVFGSGVRAHRIRVSAASVCWHPRTRVTPNPALKPTGAIKPAPAA